MAGKIRIEIDTGNSAFTPHINHEVARILIGMADKIRDDVAIAPFPLKDVNGNTVGYVNFITDASLKLRVQRITEIENELAELAGDLRKTTFEDGGRTRCFEINREQVEYLEGLTEEIKLYIGEKYYE